MRYARLAAEQGDAVIIGDSVVWGEYVTPEGTLSHYLNRQGGQHFANLGLGGAHQLALIGLVTHYASAIENTTVVLQCNPLWMSSRAPRSARRLGRGVQSSPAHSAVLAARAALSGGDFRPACRAGRSSFPFNQWTNHIQQAYYDRGPIPAWTIVHPYEIPFTPLTRGLPALDHNRRSEELPWFKTGKAKTHFEWFDEREQSLQFRAFKEVVEVLKRRGNRVFVLVGPLNEHMLADDSLRRYEKVKTWIKEWLEQREIAHAMPPALASEQYGDMSHPLAAGYAAAWHSSLPASRSFETRRKLGRSRPAHAGRIYTIHFVCRPDRGPFPVTLVASLTDEPSGGRCDA